MRTMRTRTSVTLAVGAIALIAVSATSASAQQGTKRPVRRQQPIEIRGQVPTPQVVTVRPREVPQYNRRFLVPNFYNHDFWPDILPGYQLVSRRLVTGNVRLDSLAGTDSSRMADSTRAAAQARATLGYELFAPLVGRAPAPGDSTRRLMAPGTMPGSTTPGSTTPPTGTNPTTGGTPPASRPR